MARTAIGLVILVLALIVSGRSDAQPPTGLGCATGQADAPAAYATCSVNEDCAPVGGIGCTTGICYCPNAGPISPYCACLAAGPATGAPAASGAGLIALITLLCAVGAAGLWRRTANRHAA